MSLDEIRMVVENLNTPRRFKFNIFGGEPLMREDILEVIDIIQQNMPNSSIFITTNGSFLRKYALELLMRNVALAVSLDGITPAVNDKVRGAGTFHQIIGNLAYLVALKKEIKDSKSTISIAYTITNYSEEPDDIIQFCENVGVNSLVMSVIIPQGSAARNRDLLVDIHQLIGYIERLYLAMQSTAFQVNANLGYPIFTKYFNAKYGTNMACQYVGCRAITTDFYIRPNGIFTACPITYPNSEAFKVLGLWEPSLIDHCLEDILQDKSFQRLVELKNPGSYPKYEPCNQCGFAGNYCDPCWINDFLGMPTSHSMCSVVAGMLDEMQIEWRKC